MNVRYSKTPSGERLTDNKMLISCNPELQKWFQQEIVVTAARY